MAVRLNCSTDAYLTVSEAAKELGVKPRVVYYEIQQGRLRAVLRRGTAKPYLISGKELRRWLREELVPVGVSHAR